MYNVQFSKSKTSVYYFSKIRKQHIKMQRALDIKQTSVYNRVETNTSINCLQLTYSYWKKRNLQIYVSLAN